MIPRFKPYLGKEEVVALFKPSSDAVARFETEFARAFEAKHALAFPYGRSALWAFFKAVELDNAEIILPAYTCSVVAHAIVLSGNIPRFVDIRLDDYNMDLDQVEAAINERTRAIVATHLFGYPLDVDRLAETARVAESRYGHKIWVVQDCAHSFGARWKGSLVCNAGDVALFGLGISKTMTSIFGGMLTLNDAELAERLRAWRNAHFRRPGSGKTLRRQLYLLATYAAFQETLYGFVSWLEEETPLLDRLTKAYHLDEEIHFPPDYADQMLVVEAQVGRAQLRKYPEIVQRRQANACFYDAQLRGRIDWAVPPLVAGATYSHYVIRVPDRIGVMRALARRGAQLGQLIEYSVPHLAAYAKYRVGQEFPNALTCSRHTINLPVFADLHSEQRERIARLLLDVTRNAPQNAGHPKLGGETAEERHG